MCWKIQPKWGHGAPRLILQVPIFQPNDESSSRLSNRVRSQLNNCVTHHKITRQRSWQPNNRCTKYISFFIALLRDCSLRLISHHCIDDDDIWHDRGVSLLIYDPLVSINYGSVDVNVVRSVLLPRPGQGLMFNTSLFSRCINIWTGCTNHWDI